MTALNKQALRDNANSIIGILENIAGYEPSDIDGDNVELRFEDECGVDTGCDVSIVDQCHKAADVMRSLLDDLEAAEKRIAEQREYYEGVIADGSRRIAELEARTVCLPKLPVLGSNAEWYEGFAAGASGMRNECADAIRAAGIGVKGE
ncbi:ead/Ea22-like family protein [Citrobacter braakii]|uniref:Ead/Ea22-like family protein n=1 Tax=Citrobacter braakii TaxID=57706 RepID=A0A8I0KPP4_CITBR|nr:ead/Ea22-like family protein [Citrobacter braakii]MBD3125435.1 ead/Ea22-like family protein [Citrobacter braakii]